MRAVITVVGKDTVGILAKVSQKCAESNVNINEVTQSVLEDIFCMIMVADISKINKDFGAFSEEMKKMGCDLGMSVNVMHETIFNSMHRI